MSTYSIIRAFDKVLARMTARCDGDWSTSLQSHSKVGTQSVTFTNTTNKVSFSVFFSMRDPTIVKVLPCIHPAADGSPQAFIHTLPYELRVSAHALSEQVFNCQQMIDGPEEFADLLLQTVYIPLLKVWSHVEKNRKFCEALAKKRTQAIDTMVLAGFEHEFDGDVHRFHKLGCATMMLTEFGHIGYDGPVSMDVEKAIEVAAILNESPDGPSTIMKE